MKILLVQDYLRNGGTERQTVLLANAFSAVGHTVAVVTFRPGGPLAITLGSKVTHTPLQSFDTHLDWFAPGLGRCIQAKSPDITLCMGRMANCYGSSIVRAIRNGQRRSAVIGTMRTGKKLPLRFRHSLQTVHHIAANSRAAQRHLETNHGLPREKISVLYNSLVFAANDTPPERNTALRQHYGADEHTCVLLDVAMFRPEKNQRELIEIAVGLPDEFPWQLWLAGEGPARAACERLAGELGVSNRVRFPGFMRDPSPLYAAADLAVHVSHSESLSNFLIEAQAHGLPAIAYAAQGVDECFIPDDTGLAIPFGDQQAFRAAIRRFADYDPARRQRACTFARNTFDSAQQVQAYLDLFTQLVKA